jgi:hypothetical protein
MNGPAATGQEAEEHGTPTPTPGGWPRSKRRIGSWWSGLGGTAQVALITAILALAGTLAAAVLARSTSATEPSAQAPLGNPAGGRPAPPPVPAVTSRPAYVVGTVINTYSNSLGAYIGVSRYPTAFSRDGRENGPPQGAKVYVVCQERNGRFVKDSTNGMESTIWDRIYIDNSLWFVSDIYVQLPSGSKLRNCPRYS